MLEISERVFRTFCNHTGFKYDKSLLEWQCTTQTEDIFIGWEAWAMKPLQSGKFHPVINKAKPSPNDLFNFPTMVHKTVEDNMPYYTKMYALRAVSHE